MSTNPNTLTLFRNSADTVSFDAGQVIFEKGDPGDFMYAIIEGEVEILVGEKVIETVGPDGLVGEMALIDKNPRSATVRATTACKLAPVDVKRFTHIVAQNPYFALKVMAIMSERLRRWMATVE